MDFHSVFACLLSIDCCFLWYMQNIHRHYIFNLITQTPQVCRTFFAECIIHHSVPFKINTCPNIYFSVSTWKLAYIQTMESSVSIRSVQKPSGPAQHVAAIDFGTRYSGYAFTSRSDFLANPLRIGISHWKEESGKTVFHKAPSCILFDPHGNLYSFGANAKNKYAELSLDNFQEKWFFFERFKTVLFDNQVSNISFFHRFEVRIEISVTRDYCVLLVTRLCRVPTKTIISINGNLYLHKTKITKRYFFLQKIICNKALPIGGRK